MTRTDVLFAPNAPLGPSKSFGTSLTARLILSPPASSPNSSQDPTPFVRLDSDFNSFSHNALALLRPAGTLLLARTRKIRTSTAYPQTRRAPERLCSQPARDSRSTRSGVETGSLQAPFLATVRAIACAESSALLATLSRLLQRGSVSVEPAIGPNDDQAQNIYGCHRHPHLVNRRPISCDIRQTPTTADNETNFFATRPSCFDHRPRLLCLSRDTACNLH